MVDNPPPPPLLVRWMRPRYASAILELSTAPVALTFQKQTTWVPLTEEESCRCEAAWQNLTKEEQMLALDGSDGASDQRTPVVIGEPENDVVGVTIMKDKLFEVDVRRMQLRPIYWKINIPPIYVYRGTWFYNDHHPVTRALSERLEELYIHVKPWFPSYELELQTAFELGVKSHAKLKQPLDEGRFVIFEDVDKAFIITNKASKSFLTFQRSKPSTLTFYPGSTPVYRGYHWSLYEPTAERSQISERDYDLQRDQGECGITRDDGGHVYKANDTMDREHSPSAVSDHSEVVTDLILVIHGIGQGLVSQYEGFDFVYAVNLFRQIALKQATTPALASIMRDRRVQLIPVQWRINFKFGDEEEKRRREAGVDNEFTLEDITIQDSVPYVRDLMNKVLIDIPYFMSHHKDQMISAVVQQANRIYRLWCARNPGFDQDGRVHILAHSLGSALAGNILSNQPTLQPCLLEMDASYIQDCKTLFLFNTSLFFMIGSPFPLFVHINRTQTIARKGRERTSYSPPDEALENVGLFGCLAADSVYNIFNPSDPIAYLLNPTVDGRRAKEMRPAVIKSIYEPVLSTFSSRVSRFFEGVLSSPPQPSNASSPILTRAQSGYELGGPVEHIAGTREERRFLALNPHGTVDFVLPAEGKISSYLDMITAHSAYWSDPNLAAFILAEIFARKEDFERTGLGIERAQRS